MPAYPSATLSVAVAVAVAVALAFAFAIAVPGQAQAGDPRQITPGVDSRLILGDADFLNFHPDIRFRDEGMRALASGNHAGALANFMRAARYADKASQAMLAEMHFHGRGVAQDRALGYAWMDLAAERSYPVFLVTRERYWAALEAPERERAIALGQNIYDEYEDAVAQPRLERLLRRGRLQVTGGQAGASSNLQLEIIGPGGLPLTIQGHQFYDDRFWVPEKYWAWQEEVWGSQAAVDAAAAVPPRDR